MIRLKGGLGNQLFQFAFGNKMEKEFGCKVLFDTRALSNANSPREFELYNFNFFSQEKDKFIFKGHSNLIYKLVISLYSRLGWEYSEGVVFDRPGNYSGFWQSIQYFDFSNPNCVNKFAFQESVIKNYGINREINEVALHIRGTDFLTDSNCENLTWDYYENGLKLLGYPSKIFLITVFTDDPEYVKRFVPKGIPYTLSNSKYPFQDLLLFSQFSNKILANSTFSLWAGYLASDSNTKVIVPDSKYFFSKGDLFLPEWIVIN